MRQLSQLFSFLPAPQNRAAKTLLLATRYSLLATFFLLSSCSYQLGTSSKTTYRKLYIAPITNDASNLPQVVSLLSTQLRDTFNRDARLIIVNNPSDADAILNIRLTNYSRTGLVSQPEDTGLRRKFALHLNALLTLKQNSETLFTDRPVQAIENIYTDNPRDPGAYDAQLQSEYQALPVLSQKLADTIAHTLLDTW